VDPESPHALEVPAVIIEEATHGVLEYTSLSRLTSPHAFAALLDRARDGDRWPDIASAAWKSWDAAGRLGDGAWFVDPTGPAAPHFWPHLPRDLLLRLLADDRPTAVPYALLGEGHWTALVEFASASPSLARDEKLWEHAPGSFAELLLDVTDVEALPRSALAVLWRRFATNLGARARRLLVEREVGQAMWLVETAPDEHAGDLLELFESFVRPLDLKQQLLLRLRRWLHGVVRRRSPGWRRAYAILSRIERGLEALQERGGA
jgi:hypothetical protein